MAPAWPAAPGYDLATGLGSINAANLVVNWSSAEFTPTMTTLEICATHSPQGNVFRDGQPVRFSGGVSATGGPGTPTGDVSLVADVANGVLPADTFVTLSDGAFGFAHKRC